MGRPSLEIGTYGDIYTVELPPDKRGRDRWLARAQYRDIDGKTRPVKRHGSTENKAKKNLRDALAKRSGVSLVGEVTTDTRLSAIAELWFVEQERLVEQGTKKATSVDTYREKYEAYIKPAVGDLTFLECNVTRMHNFVADLAKTRKATAALCKSILSGILGFAVIRIGKGTNPMRDVGTVKKNPKRKVQALEAEQIKDWLTKLDASDYAKGQDLPDISRMLLATGVRIGELLGIHWEQVDLEGDTPTVDIAFHVVWRKGIGPVLVDSTKAYDDRLLDLPSWAVKMLKRRRLATGGTGAIFTHPANGGYRNHREVGTALRAVRTEAGYPWLTSHSLGRKTVATILDQGGATAREIADQLGHSNPSMTQDVYMARGRATTRQASILEGIDEAG